MRADRISLLALLLLAAPAARAGDDGGDLEAVRRRGVLRHLGIPYANFVTGGGDGFDVVTPRAPDPEAARPAPIRGDVISTGMTVLPWRARSVLFSTPVFPTQVWVVARASSPVAPIQPTGRLQDDILSVKALLGGKQLLGVPETCLDPSLYALEKTGARLELKQLRLDEVAPVLIQGEGDLALLDVADAMVALQRFPGKLKVIGPVSPPQTMAVAFRRTAPHLREAFEVFLAEIHRDGTYDRLIATYFPEAPLYFQDFFAAK
jgi:ABC-type amino acid transport substrate-binding protein